MKTNYNKLSARAWAGFELITLIALFLLVLFCAYRWDVNHTQSEMKININHLYAKSGEVIAVDPNLDTMTFVDKNGNIWEVFGSEDWMVQDRVCAIFYDENTIDLLDDSVIKVIYICHSK